MTLKQKPLLETLTDALLELIETKPLEKVTVTDLLVRSGVSRNRFYANFADIRDLICTIYWEKIAGQHWSSLTTSYADYHHANLTSLKKVKNRYGKFLMQALLMQGQNCLQEYILKNAVAFEMDCVKKYYTDDTLDDLRFAVEFYEYGQMNAKIKWIREGMKEPVDVLAGRISRLRFTLLCAFMPDQTDAAFFYHQEDSIDEIVGHH